MKELNGRADNELNSLQEEGGRQEYKLARREEKPKLKTQEECRILSQEPREQRDKIHAIKMELSTIAKEQQEEGKVVSETVNPVKEKPPTLMERFVAGLNKLKEWFARRRREKFTLQLREIEDQQVELIPVQLVLKKEFESIPHFALGEYKEGIAEKVITAIEHIAKYISKAVKAVFSKRKEGNQSIPETSQPVNKVQSLKFS